MLNEVKTYHQFREQQIQQSVDHAHKRALELHSKLISWKNIFHWYEPNKSGNSIINLGKGYFIGKQ